MPEQQGRALSLGLRFYSLVDSLTKSGFTLSNLYVTDSKKTMWTQEQQKANYGDITDVWNVQPVMNSDKTHGLRPWKDCLLKEQPVSVM